ncbi:DUF1150 family protein [Acidocella sp.]|jgi:hypothetical protein|uniref:DUF1150 family protein n=1 Tax=Acidocella sp. TaxID=50710 RepID=UPI002F4253DA
MAIKRHDGTDCAVLGTSLAHYFISTAQLESLGVDEIAFVKPVITNDGPAFSIHAADGTPMAIASNAQLAAAAIIQNDMIPKMMH